jgi:hypothetical protein
VVAFLTTPPMLVMMPMVNRDHKNTVTMEASEQMERQLSLSHDEWFCYGSCVFVKLCCLSIFICQTSRIFVSMLNHAMVVELCNA